MQRSFRDVLLRSGAVMDGATSMPLHFGEAASELDAALRRCVVVDRTPFARVLASGPDLLDLLQRLSTGDLSKLGPDQGRATVVTSPKGRIVERLFVHRLAPSGVLLCGGPGGATQLLRHLARYTFVEDTGLEDQGMLSAQFALSGPTAGEALSAGGFEAPRACASRSIEFEGETVHILGQDGLDESGFSFVVPGSHAASLWQSLVLAARKAGGGPAGSEAIEAYRIIRGIPLAGHELTEEYNPLEAGLIDAVSFDKGCYVGQEVVARLRTYDKITRRLMGLELQERGPLPTPGTPLYDGPRESGRVTSTTRLPGDRRSIGLAYVKHQRVETGATLHIGSADASAVARVVELPFCF